MKGKSRRMKEMLNNNDAMKKKIKKPVIRKIWPMAGVEDQEEWTREAFLQQIINPPGQPRSRNLLPPNGFIDTQDSSKNDSPESFHCAIGFILGVAQFFGLLPVSGVRAASPTKLIFKIFSFRAIYAVLIIIMVLIVEIISIAHMIQTLKPDTFGLNGGIAAATAGAVFYGNSVIGAMLFIWLAPRWPSLQRDWRGMERSLDRIKHPPLKLGWKFSMITTVVMSLALLEHILSIANNTPPDYWSGNTNLTLRDLLQIYTEQSHGFIFSICEYNLAMGIFIFSSSKVGTFTWNFTDLFVMLVSTGLAERYKNLNKKLTGTTLVQHRNIDWRELREAYAALSSLVKRVDNNISPIILLSFINNLYFICLQLLNGLSPGESTILSSLYFFGSFAFLIGRTMAVTLLASRINDQSKLALPALYNCPGADYNIEIFRSTNSPAIENFNSRGGGLNTQRLLQQITTDDVALTGMRFFSITRNFMLAVAGAIVTYEVVLLQFNVAMKK